MQYQYKTGLVPFLINRRHNRRYNRRHNRRSNLVTDYWIHTSVHASKIVPVLGIFRQLTLQSLTAQFSQLLRRSLPNPSLFPQLSCSHTPTPTQRRCDLSAAQPLVRRLDYCAKTPLGRSFARYSAPQLKGLQKHWRGALALVKKPPQGSRTSPRKHQICSSNLFQWNWVCLWL